MAAWLIHEESGVWKIGFRWEGKLYKRSLKTTDESRANGLKERASANLFDLEQGRLQVPPGADLLTFLLTDGKKTEPKVPSAKPLTLKGLFDAYEAALPSGAKSHNTLSTEKVHRKHILRVLGEDTAAVALAPNDLQRYVNERSKEKGRRGRLLGAATIKKELGTLSSVWHWAKDSGLVKTEPPTKGLMLPKTREKEPFQTRKQIEQKIARGGLSVADVADLWASLYLEREEIDQILVRVKQKGRERWVYPMFVFVACTGARRSEAIRSCVEDFDFDNGILKVREKKRGKGNRTFRHIPISSVLAQAMKEWLSAHPGGQRTFCDKVEEKLSVNMTNHHFHWALEESEWFGKLAGWHVFRHSFASICARRRVDQRMIDKWMGHQTEAMRKRYQHLFPADEREQMSLVFG
jgi:integrase